NGAGKSTTLELILGLRAPDGGSVTYWCDEPRRQIGVQLQTTPFFRGLTAAENLVLFARFYGVRLMRRAARDILCRCALAVVAGTEASKLSVGQPTLPALPPPLPPHPHLTFPYH